MIDPFTFRLAAAADEPALTALLAAEHLPVEDVSVARHEYVLAFLDGALAGSVGLEPHGADALLRSLAVVPALRRRGLAAALLERILERCRARGVRTAWVLTTTAERFCLAHGFERVERAAVPAAIAGTAQFRSLCPASAACLRREVAPSAR